MKLMLATLAAAALLTGADDKAWPWSGASDDKAVTLLLLGDVSVEQRSNPAAAMQHVRETLSHADLVYGNLEGLLVKSKGPDQDIPDKSGWTHIGPEAIAALKAGNIQVVGVANNVAYGPADILKSLAVLDAAGIQHTGAGANIDAAHQPAILERKGVKIGFLQYTAKWYQEDQQIATATRPGVARIKSTDGKMIDPGDLDRLREDIRRLRPQVDILIVSSHNRDGLGRVIDSAAPETKQGSVDPAQLIAPIPLGPQFSQSEPYEKELAHAAIDAGADIVYGHGSHVLKGVEIYKNKPVMYCLGNFATDWIRMRPNKEGMVARVVIENKRVARVSLVPVTRDGENNNVLMLDPSAGEGAKLLQKVKDLSSGPPPLKVDGQEAILLK
ncbi:MAG TPA: CapA family protein [Bryobacteraceae bacterium]|jgi:poly-gamma-glutamate synthesis protein (capsule biosynthesis protein)